MNSTFSISSPIRHSASEALQSPTVKARTMSGTMTYTLKQHPTTTFILPLKDTYKNLAKLIHQYSVECYLSETMPEMATQFVLVSKSFEHFMELANQFYQGVNLSPRGRTSLRTSALQVAARALIENWMEFIEIMNDVFHHGLSFFYQLIPKYFAAVNEDLNITLESFKSYSYKTDVPAGAIRRLKDEVYNLQDVGAHICKQCQPKYCPNLEDGEFLKTAKKFIDRIFKFFSVTLPKQTITSGQVFKCRSRINASCGELEAVIKGAMKFKDLSEEVKAQIIEVNKGMDLILTQMEFPFGLQLDVIFDEGYEEPVDRDVSNDVAKEKIDALKHQIREASNTIDNAQVLLNQ